MPSSASFGKITMNAKKLVWISVLLMVLMTHEGEKGLTILPDHLQTNVNRYTEILAKKHTHPSEAYSGERGQYLALSTLPST